MRAAVAVAALLLAGCASGPIIDPKSSKTPENFYLDQMECERISENVSYPAEMAKSSFMNAILSGLMGAALAGGNVSAAQGAQVGAVSGAIVGAGTGAYGTFSKRQKIVTKCLQGRGYSVLD